MVTYLFYFMFLKKICVSMIYLILKNFEGSAQMLKLTLLSFIGFTFSGVLRCFAVASLCYHKNNANLTLIVVTFWK